MVKAGALTSDTRSRRLTRIFYDQLYGKGDDITISSTLPMVPVRDVRAGRQTMLLLLLNLQPCIAMPWTLVRSHPSGTRG